MADTDKTRKAAFAALAASNDALLSELDRQQRAHFDKILELQNAFIMRAPTEAELAEIDGEEAELDKIRARKNEIVMLEFAQLDSSSEVADMIGKVGQINKSLQAEKKAVEGIVEKVQNVQRLIKGVDAVLKSLLTIATLIK
jgi:hypothetical protein